MDWLLVPRNRSLLPRFLQKQIEIGEALSKRAANTEGLVSTAADCLTRTPNGSSFILPTFGICLPEPTTTTKIRLSKLLWQRHAMEELSGIGTLVVRRAR